MTDLHTAARMRDLPALERALESSHPDELDESGQTALAAAVEAAHAELPSEGSPAPLLDVVQVLLNAGATVPQNRGFMVQLQGGDLEAVRALLEKEGAPKASPPDLNNALLVGSLTEAGKLLAEGFSYSALLHTTMSTSDPAYCVRATRGAQPSREMRLRLLCAAAAAGLTNVTDAVLKKRAVDPNAYSGWLTVVLAPEDMPPALRCRVPPLALRRADEERNLFASSGGLIRPLPLHLAALNGHYDVIILLIANGADVDATVDLGRQGNPVTALHLAAASSKAAAVRALGFSGVLVEMGIETRRGSYLHKHLDVNAADSNGDTALHYACRTLQSVDPSKPMPPDTEETIKELLRGRPYGPNVGLQNNQGQTPLVCSHAPQGSAVYDQLVALGLS